MAQEKEASQTEKPTKKRVRDARKQGQVSKSKDLSASLLLIVWFGLAWSLTDNIYDKLSTLMESAISGISEPFALHLPVLTELSLTVLVLVLAPLLFFSSVAGTLFEFFQVGPLIAPKKVTPDFNSLNPGTGLKRMFSTRSLVEVIKALLKSVLLIGIALIVMGGLLGTYSSLGRGSVENIGPAYWLGIEQLFLWVIIVFALVSLIDVVYQKYELTKQLQMSKRDIRQEHKNTDGSPEMKGERRKLHREWSQTGVMNAVLRSKAVVRNPTHVSVAIAYDEDEHDLPVVVAKGVDEAAAFINEIAHDAGIPSVELPPLARALNESIDVDAYITSEFFQAVAEVLSLAEKINQESEQSV